MALEARDPGISGYIGNRVLIAGQIFGLALPLIHDAVESLGFVMVALLAVGNYFLRIEHKMMGLTEHRTDAPHLKHEPLDRDRPFARIRWQ